MPPDLTNLRSWAAYIFQGRLGWLAISSFFINIGLIIPALFSMLVYDKVVHNGIFETLWALAIGVTLFLAAEITVRALRVRDVERVGWRLIRKLIRAFFIRCCSLRRAAGCSPEWRLSF